MLDKALHILEFLLVMCCLLCSAKLYICMHNAESRMKVEMIRLERELAESEARCQRMTDTCISILSNGVWE